MSLPKCPNQKQIDLELQRWVDEVLKFIEPLKKAGLIDDLEIFIRHRSSRGWSLKGRDISPSNPPAQGECYLRLFLGGHSVWGRFPLVVSTWRDGLIELMKRIPPQRVGSYRPPEPRAVHPRPALCDVHLLDEFGDSYRFQRLAFALSDNTWHESERIEGLTSLDGSLMMHLTHRISANFQGLVCDSQSYLESKIAINQCFEDRKINGYCPSSFLPNALLGSNIWRRRGGLSIAGTQILGTRCLILHPRVVEQLLRQRLPLLLSTRSNQRGMTIAAPAFTMTHEPTIDGMQRSVSFDDLGYPRLSRMMIDQGVLTEYFDIDPLCALWTPRGLRPDLSNFFIRPGSLTLGAMKRAKPQPLIIERVKIHPIDPQKGPNHFTVSILEGLTPQGTRLPINQYQLSGTILSEGENKGILDSATFSKELVDTSTAVLPHMLLMLTLSTR